MIKICYSPKENGEHKGVSAPGSAVSLSHELGLANPPTVKTRMLLILIHLSGGSTQTHLFFLFTMRDYW